MQPDPTAAPARILIVEDERIVARDIERALQALGYVVVGNVATGEDAVAQAEETAPDLVLMDIRLAGGMDGIEAARNIRARAPIPVVFLTAFSEPKTLERAQATDPAGYLVKPFRDQQLFCMIETALHQTARALTERERTSALEASRTTLKAYTRILEARALGSEERYRIVMEQANDAIFLSGTDGRITEVNRHTEVLFGRPAADLIGRRWGELAPPAEVDAVHGRVDALVSRGAGAAEEIPIERPDGETRWVDFTGAVVQLPGGPAIVSIARDTTDRRRAREALRQSEERFRALVSSMEEMVFTLDSDLRVEGLYGRHQARLGIDHSLIVGKTAYEIYGPELGEVHVRAATRALAGERVEYAWSMPGANGALQFETVLSPMALGDGAAITGVVGISRDVTEKQELQRQIITSDRMASIGMLAAGLAHEINNPLAAVMTNVQLALQDVDDLAGARSAEVAISIREELSDARVASERVRDIVRDLRIFARKEDERPVLVDVVAVMESTLRMAWNEVRHRARLHRDYASVPPVLGSESRLGQVFLNLVVNGAQAIGEGRAEANEIRVRTRPEGDRVVIEISDTGPGLATEVQRRLFDPFVTTKPVGVGTGLGLSICHRIVTEMGGEIAATSAPGNGTTFRIDLPAAPRAEEVAQPDAVDVVPSPCRRGSVLVIDDEPAIGRAVRRVLGSAHDVTTVTSGKDGLARIASGERFDLILCDVMMPEMMGVDVHAALLKTVPDQARRLAFLTGGVFASRAREYLDATSTLRFDKPFEMQGLRRFVEERLRAGAALA